MSVFNNKAPIYLQLMDEMKKKILAGEIKPGEKLPSVRDIAMDQGVNPNTAQKALTQLETEGLIITNRTSGKFVTENAELIKGLKDDFAKAVVLNFLIKMTSIGFTDPEILTYVEKIQKARIINV
ncbi:MAG: GntR family transcriptional regulator [Clostridiales bacterium]